MGIEVILGPPGTGKTHELREVIVNAVKGGIDPSDIGCLTFGKAAAKEARDRVLKDLPDIPLSHFRNFSTLHSLCFRATGTLRSMLLADPDALAHYRQALGIRVNWNRKRRWHQLLKGGPELDSDLDVGRMTEDERMVSAIDLARNTLRDPEEVYENDPKVDRPTWPLRDLLHRMRVFKTEFAHVDFTDLLEQARDEMVPLPRFRLLCIDEAQDLSTLQWAVVDRLIERSDRVVMAGDDDQAIFRWAGADVERFQSFALKWPTRVLDQSVRVPRKIADVANQAVSRIHARVPKLWTPRDADGEVIRCNPYDVDMSIGVWLVVCPYAFPLRELFTHTQMAFKKNAHQIEFATVHEAKGREAQNVLFVNQLTVDMDRLKLEDDAIRVLYVALTRAREKLVIGESANGREYNV